MIPPGYRCAECKVTGVKLWRQGNTFGPITDLLCVDCVEKREGVTVDLSRRVCCGSHVLAIPTLRSPGEWWGHLTVPAEGLAWWNALPLRLEGGWKVRGGHEQWVPHGLWYEHMDTWELRSAQELPMEDTKMLVFIPEKRDG